MSDLPQPSEVSTDLSGFIASYTRLGEMLRVIADVATGYRKQLEEQGWSPCVAEQLAGQALSVWQAGILR